MRKTRKIPIRDLFSISYEKQIIYFVLLLLVFFGFTEIIAISFIRKMEYTWTISKKTEFGIIEEEVSKIIIRPREEAKRRFLALTENPNLKRIVILDDENNMLYDTSPYSEKIRVTRELSEEPLLMISREGGMILTSYWSRAYSGTGKPLTIILFSPREEIPYLLRFLKVNSFIRIGGTCIGFILGIYFIIFVLSPFRRMGEIAKTLKKKEVKSVEEIVTTFNETIKELKGMYAKEKQKVKRMEKEISMKEHLASLGEMSAGIAHEFKNSLGAIIGFTGLALKEKDNQEYIQKVHKEAQALNNVVNEFLFFAKPQHLERESISLQEIISELTKDPPEKITVTVTMNNTPCVFADKHLLERAFSNIIRNAYESMPDGGAFSVCSIVHPRKRSISIIFKDEGTGISSRVKRQVFTPFFSTKADGSGLGLSIVYKVISLHNGKVRLKSLRKGTIVEIELPTEQVA